jgi:hypothetical protein
LFNKTLNPYYIFSEINLCKAFIEFILNSEEEIDDKEEDFNFIENNFNLDKEILMTLKYLYNYAKENNLVDFNTLYKKKTLTHARNYSLFTRTKYKPSPLNDLEF